MKENLKDYTDGTAQRVAYLIAGFINGTLSVKEHDELDEWVNTSDENMQLFEELTDEDNLRTNLEWMDRMAVKARFEKDISENKFDIPVAQKSGKRNWLIAAAAVLLIIMGLLAYRLNIRQHHSAAGKETAAIIPLHPGGGKVLLTRESETKDLDLIDAAALYEKERIRLDKESGTLDYSAITGNDKNNEHQLQTTTGGVAQVILADGSKIRLNAASALRYPSQMAGEVREVTLTGEGYFEIAKNKRPFRVLSGSQVIEVLGTHFNLRAYQNEKASVTTLLEGNIKITVNGKTKWVVPGEQAIVKDSEVKIMKADTMSVMAWTEHTFRFSDASIEVVMDEIARWYHAEVEIRERVDAHFNATIDRSEPLEKLLRYLEGTGAVHFTIEGNKIIVMK